MKRTSSRTATKTMGLKRDYFGGGARYGYAASDIRLELCSRSRFGASRQIETPWSRIIKRKEGCSVLDSRVRRQTSASEEHHCE